MLHIVPITAIFPTYDRLEDALRTLDIVKACQPRPDEIIVHVDGGMEVVARELAAAHPDVKVLLSDQFLGPGGGRNVLVHAARNDLVANFDDDSAPEHPDYFARAWEVAECFPEAAVISAASLPEERTTPGFMRIAIFSGCGFVCRRSWFLRTEGFVPLRVAYCMEEVDLSLRLYEIGGMIVHDPLLRVEHRKRPNLSVSGCQDAAVMANIGLMPMLRYPWPLVPLALGHVLLRAWQLVRRQAWPGLLIGLAMLPGYVIKHWCFRTPVGLDSLLAWNALRRAPECLRLFPSLLK